MARQTWPMKDRRTVLERDEEDRHEDWEVVRRLGQAAVANETVQPVETVEPMQALLQAPRLHG